MLRACIVCSVGELVGGLFCSRLASCLPDNGEDPFWMRPVNEVALEFLSNRRIEMDRLMVDCLSVQIVYGIDLKISIFELENMGLW